MRLYLLTPPQTTGNELPLVLHFLECGLHKLHIRKPEFSIGDYRNYIAAIPVTYHDRLVIHGAFELVQAFPALGVHFRSHDRQDTQLVQQVRQLRPASCSSSFHAWEEISSNENHYDYVFISPVFDSISKKGYKAGIDLEGRLRLRQWAAAHKKQLPGIVGLGGVGPATIARLNETGFEGAALLGAIWEAAHPARAFADVQQAIGNPAGS